MTPSTKPLHELTAELVRPHLASWARVLDDDDRLLCEAELVEVSEVGGPASAGRRPFSILFRGPPAPVLAQRIYRVSHEGLGTLQLFLVPVGPDEAGMRYEAIFG